MTVTSRPECKDEGAMVLEVKQFWGSKGCCS